MQRVWGQGGFEGLEESEWEDTLEVEEVLKSPSQFEEVLNLTDFASHPNF